MAAQARHEWYPGPDGTRYDLQDPKQLQAWDDAWADHQGVEREDVTNASKRQTAGTPGPVDPVQKARQVEAVAYVSTYTGSWAFILDLRADRSFGTKYFHLTEKQVDVVLASKAREEQWALEAVAKIGPRYQEALDYLATYAGTFDFLLDIKARNSRSLSERQVEAVLKCRDRENTAQRPGTTGTRPATVVTQDGFYKHGEAIVKVQVAVHGSGNLYAKRLIVSEYGKATWEYTPGLVRDLTEAERLTFDQAVEFGRLYGVCGVCGRTLTDEVSIEAGIGPICAGRLSA